VADPVDQVCQIGSFNNLSVGGGETLGLVARFIAHPVEPAPVPELCSMLLRLTGGESIGRGLARAANSEKERVAATVRDII